MPPESKIQWLADKFEIMGPPGLKLLLSNWNQSLLIPAGPDKEFYYSLARVVILAAEENESARKVVDFFCCPYPVKDGTHSGDNVCYQCRVSFTRKEMYIAHQRVVHRRNFFCNYCTKAYVNINDLDIHHKTSHGIILPHVCFMCFDSFRTPHGLNKHLTLAKNDPEHGKDFR